MGNLLEFLSRLFSWKNAPGDYKVAEGYSGLRELALGMRPEKIGVTTTDPDEVWGMLMETGYPEAVATLVALGEGNVSLYFSNGGGIVGLGPHPGPQRAAKAFLAASQQFLKQVQPTNDFPLPSVGTTQFYLLTMGGAYRGSGKQDDLGHGRHALSPLFHKGHELITEIRKVDGQWGGQKLKRLKER